MTLEKWISKVQGTNRYDFCGQSFQKGLITDNKQKI